MGDNITVPEGDSRLYLASTQPEAVSLLGRLNEWLEGMTFSIVRGRKNGWWPDPARFTLPDIFRGHYIDQMASFSISVVEGPKMIYTGEGIVDGLEPVIAVELSHDSLAILWRGLIVCVFLVDGMRVVLSEMSHNGRIFLNPALSDGDYFLQVFSPEDLWALL